MAVPKRKTSPSRRNMRRSHDALKRKQLVVDESGEYKLPHHISLNGQYKNRQISTIKRKRIEEDEAN